MEHTYVLHLLCKQWNTHIYIYIHIYTNTHTYSMQILKFVCFVRWMNIQIITYQWLCKTLRSYTQCNQEKTIASCSIMIQKHRKNAQNCYYLLNQILYFRFRYELGLYASPPPGLNNQYGLEDILSQNRWLLQAVFGNFYNAKGSTPGGTTCWQIEIVAFEIFSHNFCLPNDILQSPIALWVFD